LLALPASVRAAHADLERAVFVTIDRQVREALTDLAQGRRPQDDEGDGGRAA
jgi:hypothetical protein